MRKRKDCGKLWFNGLPLNQKKLLLINMKSSYFAHWEDALKTFLSKTFFINILVIYCRVPDKNNTIQIKTFYYIYIIYFLNVDYLKELNSEVHMHCLVLECLLAVTKNQHTKYYFEMKTFIKMLHWYKIIDHKKYVMHKRLGIVTINTLVQLLVITSRSL